MKKDNKIIKYNRESVEDIFNNKAKFHKEQANLPIEEKIKIMIELQKITLDIKQDQNKKDNRVIWRLI